tara:strand:+ start:688 stop:1290 length:603 start_codon:yes stop_codon:yes gene_type:complete
MFTNNKKYILASSSRSRFKILTKCGFEFKKVKPLCDEDKIKKKINMKKTKPINVVKKLAFEKSKSVSILKKYSKSYVIGCDTIIYLDKKVFDKAKTIEEAYKKIKKLSGRKHKIVSGLVICKNGKKTWSYSETTEVKIRKLNTRQIKQYLNKTGSHILESVGCYQIESLGPSIIEEIKGDFFNVMGLPLFALLKYVSSIK